MKLMPVINLKACKRSNLANENSTQIWGLLKEFLDVAEVSERITLSYSILGRSSQHSTTSLPLCEIMSTK